jgi:hypothetical protein
VVTISPRSSRGGQLRIRDGTPRWRDAQGKIVPRYVHVRAARTGAPHFRRRTGPARDACGRGRATELEARCRLVPGAAPEHASPRNSGRENPSGPRALAAASARGEPVPPVSAGPGSGTCAPSAGPAEAERSDPLPQSVRCSGPGAAGPGTAVASSLSTPRPRCVCDRASCGTAALRGSSG